MCVFTEKTIFFKQWQQANVMEIRSFRYFGLVDFSDSRVSYTELSISLPWK